MIDSPREINRVELIRARGSDMLAEILKDSELDPNFFYSVWNGEWDYDLRDQMLSILRENSDLRTREGMPPIDPRLAYCPLGAFYDKNVVPGFILTPYLRGEWIDEEELDITEEERDEISLRRKTALMNFYTPEQREFMESVAADRQPLPQPSYPLSE